MSEKPLVRLLLFPASPPVQTALEEQIKAFGLPYQLKFAQSLPEFDRQRDQNDFDVLLLNCTEGKSDALKIIHRLHSIPTIVLVDGNSAENIHEELSLEFPPCLLDMGDVKSLSLLSDFVAGLMGDQQAATTKNLPAHTELSREFLENVIQTLSERNAVLDDLEERVQQRTAVLKATNWELHQEIARHAAAEQTVTDEHNRFRILVDTIPHGIVEFDLDGTVTFVNAEYYRIHQVPEGSLLGKKLWDVIDPESAAKSNFHTLFEMNMPQRPLPNTHFSRYRTISGKDVEVKVNWNYRRDAQGNINGGIAVITDISKQRRAEEEAQERLNQLAHVARIFTMNEMVSGLAHELNQPLAAISNFAQACRYRLHDSSVEKQDKLLKLIEQISLQADRAGHIIRRLRDFVRRADSCYSQENIDDLVGDVFDLMEIEARARSVRLETALAPDPPRITVDRIQIEQVITNLVKNAMEAVRDLPPQSRRVTVKTELNAQGMLEVSVIDTGKGIEEKELSRLFEPFYTTKQSGMGFGLAISRSIVEAHGGSLAAVKNAHRGMTFRFTLPITEQKAGA